MIAMDDGFISVDETRLETNSSNGEESLVMINLNTSQKKLK